MSKKTCKRHGGEPLPEFMFNAKRGSPDGLDDVCRPCRSAYRCQPELRARQRARHAATRHPPHYYKPGLQVGGE